MNLQTYLNRIQFTGTPRVDSDTLRRIHRQHLLTVPYENLDVQFARQSDISVENAYAKIVEQGRGGWCYEMNGLFGWALQEIGFEVMRMAGGVMREQAGDTALGNHLVLSVQLEGKTWLIDVGFGDGMLEPTPLVAGEFQQDFMIFQLAQLTDGFWRLYNHPHGAAKSFDFRYEPADEAMLARQCQWLQSAPESQFVLNLVCQRFTADGIFALKGRMLSHISATGKSKTLINSADEFESTLRERFALTFDKAQIAYLWERVVARHEVVFSEAETP